jgi:class 3 adenylate cyclase/tetratricopeptide (TPR) repeat protein
MNCAICGCDNRAGAKFCGECAASLADVVVCPRCQTPNPKTRKFCDSCGQQLASPKITPSPDPRSYTPKHLAEKILTTRSALEGERKQVTVLFADVKGSMDLASQLDPEDWHSVLDGFFRVLSDGVHRFEGTVNQYTGDGIMALFGAPIAHEDHAARACYAALHLKDELRRYGEELKRKRGLVFSARMGINSGEVIVGKIGDDLRMDYTAQGETVGLAARMEGLADPGTAYLSERTAALVTGLFILRDLGPFEVKGITEPLRVYELEGAGALRTRLEVSRSRGFSKFVGREAEMRVLETALERALRGQGQVVGVVGDPGLGKSRLCLEFVERCRGRGIFVNEGHCPPHGKSIPYLPILELWRSYFGVTVSDPDAEARRKIAGTLLLLGEAFREELPIVFEFLGVGDPERPAPLIAPEARERSLFAFLRHLTHALAERQPFVILIDDVHWIDPASDAFLAQFADAIEGRRVLFLANFRPEYHGVWLRKSHYQQLAILPLGSEAAEALLDDLVGKDPTLTSLRQRIGDRTAGNPFFVEEVVQALAETHALEGVRGAYRLARPVEALEIPGTVQIVLAARIDRLAEREKRLLQTAAVIGRTFAESILEHVAGLAGPDLASSITHLKEAEFVFEQTLYPEVEYAFKHPLTREVAYGSQLTEQRRRIHGAIARAIAEGESGKLDEQAATIAHHFEEAGEFVEAAEWGKRAAEWAGINSPAEALRHWLKVAELLRDAPESSQTIALAITARAQSILYGWRVGMPEAEAETLFNEGRALAERGGDSRSLALLLMGYGTYRGNMGAASDYLKLCFEAARVADETDDAMLKLNVGSVVPYAYYVAGRLREILTWLERYLAGVPERRGPGITFGDPYLALILFKGIAAASMGDLQRARIEYDSVLRPAQEVGASDVECYLHAVYADLGWATADVATALTHSRQAVEIADTTGNANLRTWAHAALGRALLLRGEWKGAAEESETAVRLARERRTSMERETVYLAQLAEASLGGGDLGSARAFAEEAVATAVQKEVRFYEISAQLTLARVLLRGAGVELREAIEAALRRALELVDESGAKTHEPFIRVELANLARLTRDEATRERELRAAHRLFLEIGAPIRAAAVAKELES